MVLTTRSANADDEEAVVALWRACGIVVSYNDPNVDFRAARGQANSDVLVCTDAQGKIVGTVMVGYDSHRGWIYYVAADPDFRLQGIGRRIMEAAEQWFKERKIPKFMLLVREKNKQVMGFYERLGFDVVPSIVMAKGLR